MIIKGILDEENRENFGYLIMDEDNLTAFEKGIEADCIDEGSDGGAYKVNCQVKSRAKYYLIIQSKAREYSREVNINLRYQKYDLTPTQPPSGITKVQRPRKKEEPEDDDECCR